MWRVQISVYFLTVLSNGVPKNKNESDNSEKIEEKTWSNFRLSNDTISTTTTSTTTSTTIESNTSTNSTSSPTHKGKLNFERETLI